MNNARRKELNKAIEILNTFSEKIYDAKDIVETCKDEEEEYRDNMPENLQGSEKYSLADEACDNLEQAYEYLEEMEEKVNEIISSIENATE